MSDRERQQGEHELLDAFLDGTLDEQARPRFEQRCAAEPELDAALRHQRTVDELLRRTFHAPDGLGARLADSVRREARSARPARTRSAWVWAVAALLLVGAGLTWWLTAGPGARTPVDAEAAYAQLVEASGTAVACLDEGGLALLLSARHHEALQIDSGVSLAGPLTCNAWPAASALVALVEPAPVVLLLGELDQDVDIASRPGSGLSVHRRELGSLVLYELSHGAASCLSVVRLAEVDDPPPRR